MTVKWYQMKLLRSVSGKQKSSPQRGEKEEGLLLKMLQSHLYRIPRMEMKRKEVSNESSLRAG